VIRTLRRFFTIAQLLSPARLTGLDERVEATGLAYARFMDDWVILAPTRSKLRETIRLVNRTLAELHVERHPDKTFIGRISRGFVFLGYEFQPAGLEVAPQAVERCVQRVSQLYEQGVDLSHIWAYPRRWLRWTRSGLGELGAGLSERTSVLLVRSLGLVGWTLPWRLPPVPVPAFPAVCHYQRHARAQQ
jgi:RNA-directed DNA polymerase